MPELPEVETVKNGLNQFIKGLSVTNISIYQKQLRFPVPRLIKSKLVNSGPIKQVSRRAKYLFFEFQDISMLSHLGMTGQWKYKESNYIRVKHDHVVLSLSNGKKLIYNDPRRFGWLELVDSINGYIESKNLGPEPLSKEFNTRFLMGAIKNKQAAIKSVIMDQKIVLGVGNIYACESLYKSKILPNRAADSVNKAEAQLLVKYIKSTLRNAIKAGGSTIKDFKQAGGESGYFQLSHRVYGLAGTECKKCKNKIKNIKLSGRSSFYCPECQK